MGAQGSQSEISIVEEVIWGETPVGQFEGINFVSESLSYAIENQTSNNVRSDRQTSDLIQVGASTGGGLDTEFQAANLDTLLPGFFWDELWLPVIAAGLTGPVSFAAGLPSTVTLDPADTANFQAQEGQSFFVLDATNPENNGIMNIVSIVGDVITVSNTLVDEVGSTVIIDGFNIKNGVYKHSYSIERGHIDVSQFFLYKGMVCNVLEMSVESGNPVTASLSFIGKDETLGQVSNSTPAATPPSTNPIMSSVSSIGEVSIDGVVISGCLLQKIDFSLDNQVEGKTAVGVLGFCDAVGKSINVTGSISLYFNDEVYYNKYLNSDSFSVSFDMTDSVGNSYRVSLPECKFDSMTSNVSGRDDDVMLEGSFVSIVDPQYLHTISMFRSLV